MRKNILYYGSEDPLPEKVRLKAGLLELIYENGFLRYISLGEHEVLRMINHAVRDHNWGTALFTITDEKISVEGNTFTIDYKARIKQDDIEFIWNCRISGEDDNSIRFSIEGEALSSFKRNRIGFTVLHPVKECAGKEIKITQPDGVSTIETFPILISPHQPFKNIQKMEWKLGEYTANLEFSGEVFESEDQRNWIDESYKTYCTPLDRPFPVQVEKGQKIRQEIVLKLTGTPVNVSNEESFASISISSATGQLPKIGICQSSEVQRLNTHEIDTLKKVQFDHYQADLLLYDAHWFDSWKRIKKEAKSLHLPVELSLFFKEDATEISEFRKVLATDEIEVKYINVFNKTPHSTQKETLDSVLPELRKLFTKAHIGAGTNAFFTELNRDRTPAQDLDFLVYSINPQIHAFDNDSVCETLNAIPYTIKSTKAFSNEKPVHISPITFKMRWNPNATSEKILSKDQMPDDVDNRQMSLFGAAWLTGVINNLLSESTEAVSFFETVGLKGIMQSSEPKFINQFPASPGIVYPIYLIFRFILNNKDAKFYQGISSHPNHFCGLAWGKEQADHLLLVNFQIETVSVRIPDPFLNGSILEINAENIESLMRKPDLQNQKADRISIQHVNLPPFGIVLIYTKT